MITLTVENNMLVVDGADVLIDHTYASNAKGKVFCAKRPSSVSNLPVVKIDGSIIDKFDGVMSYNGLEMNNYWLGVEYDSIKGVINESKSRTKK